MRYEKKNNGKMYFSCVCVRARQGTSSKLLYSFVYFFRFVFFSIECTETFVCASYILTRECQPAFARSFSPSQFSMIHYSIGTAHYLFIPRLIHYLFRCLYSFFFVFMQKLYRCAWRIKINKIAEKVWSFAATATAASVR